MDLTDGPPGAEGYQDSVVEMPKKPEGDESTCTKAEQEFQDHLASLKIRLENGETRPMVERRGRDISGKWIYLCYPCAAVCSGELILQGHISGRKHKTKLGMRNAWPVSIFDDHPFNQSQKGGEKEKPVAASLLKKMKEEVELHNKTAVEYDDKFAKYRDVTCHIQYSMDAIKAPMIGIEYLVEHPPEKEHYEPSYICTLCTKQGHPRTIINHMTCFWHRYNYMNRHFPKATQRLKPLMSQQKYRDGISITLNRLAQRIEDKYGRLRPVNIDKDIYERDKDKLMQWIYKGHHLSELDGTTFEEVVDVDLIESLNNHQENKPYWYEAKTNNAAVVKPKKDPSPPRVPAPKYQKTQNTRSYRNERRLSMDLSDISDEEIKRNKDENKKKVDTAHKPRWEPYQQPKRNETEYKTRYALKNGPDKGKDDKPRPPNYEYKVKLSEDKRKAAEESAKKMLAYHEKNPEKHPLYPEEWKKFWNRRYKEIQTEGKDPSKHDFKPEWIVFWTKRMKELHEDELRVSVIEIYRKMNVSPPDMNKKEPALVEKERRRSPEPRRTIDHKRFPEPRRGPPDYRRSPEQRRRSPRARSRDSRDNRREHERRRTPERRRSIDRKRSQDKSLVPDYRIGRRSPEFRAIPELRHSPSRRRSPTKQARSRSPLSRRSPPRTNIVLESMERSRSPLSRRNAELPLRNRSPVAAARDPPPSMQTVLISDEEFRPEDGGGLSPWNSDNDIDSVCSIIEMRSIASSAVSRSSRRRDMHMARGPDPLEMGPVENVVATLRMLVALEDYLGSIGPKIVDLLTDALKMEKDKANSSEELLERESAVVMIETAKEKLKGAAQAGLVASAAAPAVRAAVVRAAATLHEADTRIKRAQVNAKKKAAIMMKAEPMPVAGVGEVDRAQIAQQMAAALIAQGKTDVTSEELAQLVDAVVGMAEAKKREAETTKKVEVRQMAKLTPQPKLCGTATALQMLQSAYDENDKKEALKEEVPDAMDGLSDSDLETLLKNFNELSAEEQHSLIAYLKKLEAREPQRVERLRQYVSAAATSSASSNSVSTVTSVAPEPSPVKQAPVVLESDDDDYTVEEVIESAQQKVKEDQMRKEIEIVKKSLEELKEKETTPPKSPAAIRVVDISKNLSSASDLLALVHASIQSKAPISTPSAISTHTSNVVLNSTQPRSFGDLPSSIKSLINPQSSQLTAPAVVPQNPPPIVFDEPMRRSPVVTNFNEQYNQQDEPVPSHNNFSDEPYNQNDNIQTQSYNQIDTNQTQSYNPIDNNQTQSYNPIDNNQNQSYNQIDNNQTQSYNQIENNQTQSYNQIENNLTQSYNQIDNNRSQSYNQIDDKQSDNYNQADSYNQVDSYNQGDSYNQPQSYNQGDSFNQNEPYNQGDSFNQNESYNQNDNYKQNSDFSQNQPYNQNQNQSYMQPWNNPRQNIPDKRGPMNQGFNDFNQGPSMPNPGQNQFQPRGNFMNNTNKKQFGNFNSGNNFRGRGRGQRGRGRGRF